MIYDARDPNCPRGTVFNADTGARIPKVFRFNTETGEYWRYVEDGSGQIVTDGFEARVAQGKCRLRFEPFADEVKPDAVVSEGK